MVQKVRWKQFLRSGCNRPMVETQHTSEAPTASDGSRSSADPGGTLQQPVADSLTIALVMVVRHVFGECAQKR